jgi:pimeloyl-ACP methyl ester carboxylesterase
MKQKRRFRLLIAFSIFLPGLLGCTANKMHRPVSVQENPDFTLAFVEFDDQGEMWDPAQLSRAVKVIEELNRSEKGCIVVTYIHGWQHNASEKSEQKEKGNVNDFKEFLGLVANAMRAQEVGSQRPVVGIYIGWRGKSGTIPGLNAATFYERSGAARRIAGTSSTEVIYRLVSAAKTHPQSKIILMGHSFGGQILERAVTQALVGELLDSRETLEDRLAADLVVLINPASKSIQAKQFVEMLDRSRIELYRADSEGKRYKVPLMISITSAADLATRWAFPTGTWISAASKKFHRYPDDACMQFERQRSFYVRTPGHNEALVSHEVSARPLAEGEEPGELGKLREGLVDAEYDPVAGQHVFSFNGSQNRFTLRSLTGAANDTPYWIVGVPKQLIPGHSGFFTEDTLRLIGAIIMISGALETDSPTEVVRESAVRPTRLAVLPDGRVLVADSSRRIYEVDKSSPTPVSHGCLPELADPSSSIGFDIKGTKGWGAVSRLSSKSTRKGGTEYETLVVPFVLGEGALVVEKPLQIRSTKRFAAAAFDVDGQRVFLSGIDGQVIYVADLSLKKPTPELWLEVKSEGVINDLHYDNTSGALYASGGEDGALYRLTEQGEGPLPTLVGGSLGLPVGMAVDEERGRLFVGDAKGKQIWRIDCPVSGACAEPRSLVATELFVSPTDLDVAADGTVWVADREGEVIVALSPDGEILQTITELPAE